MEEKKEKMKISDEILKQEYASLKKKQTRRKIERILSILLIIGLIIVILLMKNCSGKKDNQIVQLTQQMDSLKNENNLLKSKVDSLTRENEKLKHQKAIPVVKNTKAGKAISALIVDGDDKRPESLFIKNEIFIPAVVVHDSFPVVDSTCIEQLDSANKEMESLLNTTIEISLNKIRQDTSISMYLKRLMIQELLLNTPLVYISPPQNKDSYNPYKIKSEKALLRGFILGGSGILVYGATELMGHAFIREDEDNSNAELKSDIITGTRIVAGGLIVCSIFEFKRYYHFHKMEGIFFANSNRIGLSINIDIPVKK